MPLSPLYLGQRDQIDDQKSGDQSISIDDCWLTDWYQPINDQSKVTSN